MSQNEFAGLFPEGREVEQPAEGKPRDSKRHEPHEPKFGRQYDRNSVKGERTRPPKAGYGRGNQGNPKDTRVREETEEQKARREQREAEAKADRENHEEYLKNIQGYEAQEIIAQPKVEVKKNHEMPAEMQSLAKKEDKKQKKDKPVKKDVIML